MVNTNDRNYSSPKLFNMKNLIVLIALTTLTLSGVQAQFMIGPKAGIGLAHHGLDKLGKDFYDSGSVLSYTGGIKMRIPLFSGIELMPEVAYTKRGGQLNPELPTDFSDSNGNYLFTAYLRETRSMSYLDIPLLLAYKFRGKEFAPYVFLGPTIGIALHGTSTADFEDQDGLPVVSSIDQDMEFGSGRLDPDNRNYVAFTIGGGFYYELEMGRLAVDLRYNVGTSNIFNEDYLGYGGAKIRNHDLTLSVAYLFSLSDF